MLNRLNARSILVLNLKIGFEISFFLRKELCLGQNDVLRLIALRIIFIWEWFAFGLGCVGLLIKKRKNKEKKRKQKTEFVV